MKKVSMQLILALLSLVAMSCSDDGKDVIWDLHPINFNIHIVDENGADMLSPASSAYDKAFIDNSRITFQGRDYRMGEKVEIEVKPHTRAYFSPFHGMQVEEVNGQYRAVVGPFMADYHWQNEKIEFSWGDGSKDEIVFSSSVKWDGPDGGPRFKRHYLFNGNDSTNVFTKRGYIILKKRSRK